MKARLYRVKRRKGLSSPEISLTPLIDTAWVLLVIFMVTSPVIKKEAGLQVELPKGNVEEVKDASSDDIVVSFDNKRVLYLDGKQVAEKYLITSLKKRLVKGADKTVFVKADIAAEYGKVIELIDKIKYRLNLIMSIQTNYGLNFSLILQIYAH